MSEHQHQSVGTDHRRSGVLSREECLRLLAATPVGRLAFVRDGEPVILPVNHGLLGEDVVFRSSLGAKHEAAVHGATVAYEVDDWDARRAEGWSVLVTGTLTEVENEDEAACEALGVHSWAYQDADIEWLRIRTATVTGRSVGPAPTED